MGLLSAAGRSLEKGGWKQGAVVATRQILGQRHSRTERIDEDGKSPSKKERKYDNELQEVFDDQEDTEKVVEVLDK